MTTDLAIPAESRETVTRRDRGLCFRCGGTGTDWHHRRSRRVRDEHTHCACNGLLLCRTCHKWAHANPRDAMELGYIVSQWSDHPGLTLVFRTDGWWHVDCAGAGEYVHHENIDM